MNLGPYAAFIWLSYAAVLVTVTGLIAWLIWDGRKQASDLAALEKRGVTRQSTSNAA
jgi:heme exporter protein D